MPITLRLLVLEDVTNDAELEIAAIEEAGYNCQWERVETREDFLTRLDTPDYDLILSDYKLPTFDGLTALGLFLERKIDIPFIMVSGRLGEEAAIESLKAGATDYVLKDHLSRLAPVVQRALKEQTEHRQRLQAESAAIRFSRVLEGSLNEIYIFDAETLRFMQVNRGARENIGYSMGELRDLTPLDLYPEFTLESFTERIGLLQTGILEKLQFTTVHLRKEGTIYPVEVHLQLMTDDSPVFVVMAIDITERKIIEEQLSEHREHLEELVQKRTAALRNTLSDLESVQANLLQSEKMAVLGRLAAGVAHEINNPLGAIGAAGRMMSHSAENLGKAIRSSTSTFQGDETIVEELFQAAANVSESPWGTQERREKRDQLLAELEGQDVEDLRGLVETIVDLGIWEQRDRYIPLLRREDGANLLGLARDVATMNRGAKIIDTATNRASKIVYALKTYAHPGVGETAQHIDVRKGIEDVLTLYRSKIEKGVDIVRRFNDDAVIEAFPGELYQAWTNVIHNSIEAMDYQGTLTISVQREDDELVVQIADTGCGMPTEVQERIFEPFFTTKESGGGCGLGMDIVKRIVDDHHGDIHIDSTEDVGTTVTIRLPVCQPKEDAE